MANSHDNTRHTRLPVRTVTRVEMWAKERGVVTKATAFDMMVEDFLERHAPHIIEATKDLPEPRRAMPPGKPSETVNA